MIKVLVLSLVLLASFKIFAQDPPSKNDKSSPVSSKEASKTIKETKGIEVTVDRTKPAETKPAETKTHETNGPHGNVGGKEGDKTNGNRTPASQEKATNKLSPETVAALQELEQLKRQWSIIKKIAIGKRIIDLIAAPPEVAAGILKDIINGDWKELAETIHMMSDAERAQIEHLVELEKFRSAERSNEAFRTNSPDKMLRKQEENFWAKWQYVNNTMVIKKDASNILVEGFHLEPTAVNNNLSLQPKFRLENLHYNQVVMKLYLYDTETDTLMTNYKTLFPKNRDYVPYEMDLIQKTSSGCIEANYPKIESQPGCTSYPIARLVVYNDNLPLGTHTLKYFVAIEAEGKEIYRSDWYEHTYTRHGRDGFKQY